MSVITEYDSLLLDLDGTVYEGGRAIEHVVSALSGAGLPVMYVTNNASRAPEVVAAQLREIGLSNKCEIDLGATGSVGKKKGAGLNLNFNWKF